MMDIGDRQQRKLLKPRRTTRHQSLPKHQSTKTNNRVQRHCPTPKDPSKDRATQTSATLVMCKENDRKSDDEDSMSSDSLSLIDVCHGNRTTFKEIALKKHDKPHPINYRVENVGEANLRQESSEESTLLKIYLTKCTNNFNDKTVISLGNKNYKFSRCDFLLQTSPFNRLSTLNAVPTLKSKPFVETVKNEPIVQSFDVDNHYKMGDATTRAADDDDKDSLQSSGNRLINDTKKSKTVGKFCNYYSPTTGKHHSPMVEQATNMLPEKMPSIIKNYLEDNKSKYRKRKSKSFMAGTIASKQKNILARVRSVNCLVSPVRKGHLIKSPTNIKYHVPYIDENKSDTEQCGNKVLERRTSRANLLADDPKDALLFTNELATDTVTINTLPIDMGITALIHRVKDPDWNVSLKALADLVANCVLHLEDYYNYLPTAQQRLLELIRSSRWYASKCACQIAANLFEIAKDTRRPEFDELVDALLSKTADYNRRIRNEANLALDCMVTNIPFGHAFRALTAKGPNHKNALVRKATVRLIICAVVLLNPTILFNPASGETLRKRVLEVMVKFALDKNQEVRRYGIRLYKVLQKESGFTVYLKKYFEKDDINEFMKSVNSISNSII